MRAFVVVVPAAEAELASDVLWQLGVRAIEERGADPVELWTAVGDDDESVQSGGGPGGGAVVVAHRDGR